MIFLSIVCIAVGVLLSLVLRQQISIDGKDPILGNMAYDIQPLEAPIATGSTLQWLEWLMTRSPFGPTIVRFLLDKNKMYKMRDLAAQIKLPPLYFPMRRLDAVQYEAATSPTWKEELTQALQEGFPISTSVEATSTGSSRPRTVAEYAAFYSEHLHPQNGEQKSVDAVAAYLPSAVMQRTLDTVRSWEQDGMLIFSSIIASDVIEQAKASDARHLAGKPLSVFDGVPVAFKDSCDVKGHIIYDGKDPIAAADYSTPAVEDDLVVSRMRELGAIIIGVTVMVEGGVSPLGWNAHWKGPLSAYSANRYSGGSSSGSAVAVATGLVPVALGYDGGGSIRIPAAMSGVHGLATSFGRIPFVRGRGSTMTKAGPLAASSEDAALLYAALAPNDLQSTFSVLYDGGYRGPPPPHLQKFDQYEDLSDMRIGIFSEWFMDSDRRVRSRCSAAVDFLRSRGATIVEISIPHLQLMSMAHSNKIASEFAMGWDKHFHTRPHDMEAMGRIVVGIGSTTSALEVISAEKIRAWGFDYVSRVLFADQQLDAIVTPTMAIEVPVLTEEAKVKGESNTALSVLVMKYVFIANFLGLPGYSVPVGGVPASAAAGNETAALVLPVGLQFLGNHWEDHKLLRLARSVEKGFTSTLRDLPAPVFFHDPLSV